MLFASRNVSPVEGDNAFFDYEQKLVREMFQKDDMVRYGAYGVCKVEDITEKNFNGEAIRYYVLRPIYNDTSTIYVPIHNHALTQNMRKVLSKEELQSLIQTMPHEESLWIENEEVRKAQYQEVLASGNRTGLIGMLKALYLHQREQQEKGDGCICQTITFLRKRKKCCMRSLRWCSASPESRLFPIF